jgi:hypothetical protein
MSLDFREKEEHCIVNSQVMNLRCTRRLGPRLWQRVTSEGLKGGSRSSLAISGFSGSKGVGELNNRNHEVAKPDALFGKRLWSHRLVTWVRVSCLVLVRIGITPKKDLWLQV